MLYSANIVTGITKIRLKACLNFSYLSRGKLNKFLWKNFSSSSNIGKILAYPLLCRSSSMISPTDWFTILLFHESSDLNFNTLLLELMSPIIKMKTGNIIRNN